MSSTSRCRRSPTTSAGSQRLLAASTDPAGPTFRDALDKAAEQALRAGEIIRRLREFVARGENEQRVGERHQVGRGGKRPGAGRRQGARMCACIRFDHGPPDRRRDGRPGSDRSRSCSICPQCDRGDGDAEFGQEGAHHFGGAGRPGRHGRDQGCRHRPGPCHGTGRAAFHALPHHQGARDGRRAVDLANDHRTPMAEQSSPKANRAMARPSASR